MEIHEIKYFIAIWESKSISKASAVVHVSQPALSQCIKKMEKELGTKLFQRPMQTMKLTEVGEIVLSYGREILNLMDKMEMRVSEVIHSDDIEITVGMSPFYSKYYLPTIIPYLKAQFPNIRIRTIEDISYNLEKMILNRELDFCCVPKEPEMPGITYETICIEEILLAIPPCSPINQQAIPANPIPYLDAKWLKDQKFVTLKSIQKISGMLTSLCNSIGLNRDIVYQTLNWDTVETMISTGLGVGFVPDILYSKDNDSTHPCYYRILNKRFLRHYCIAYKDDKSFTSLENKLIAIFKYQIASFRKKRISLE